MPASGAGGADRREQERAPPSLASVEAVADAAHGLDRAGLLRVVLHLRAEALDGHVDEPGVAEVVVVPDALQQEVASEDLARAPGELEQQSELGGAQAQLLASAPGSSPTTTSTVSLLAESMMIGTRLSARIWRQTS